MTTEEHRRYTIRTVEDLYRVPSNKLEHCLKDLMACIQSHKAIAKLAGVKCLPLRKIEWIDDGKHNIAVQIEDEAKQKDGT